MLGPRLGPGPRLWLGLVSRFGLGRILELERSFAIPRRRLRPPMPPGRHHFYHPNGLTVHFVLAVNDGDTYP